MGRSARFSHFASAVKQSPKFAALASALSSASPMAASSTPSPAASAGLPFFAPSPSPLSWEGGVSIPYRTIPDRLFEERIIMCVGTVDEAMAFDVTMKLLLMEVVHPRKPIHLYINSNGGSVADGLAIYDTMQFVQPPIHTVGIGKCMSMGAVLLAAGSPGRRAILPNTKVMVHQPLGGVQGTSSNVEAAVESMVDYRNRLKAILARHCGRAGNEVDAAFVNDTYFDAEKAVAWGIADKVVQPRKVELDEDEEVGEAPGTGSGQG